MKIRVIDACIVVLAVASILVWSFVFHMVDVHSKPVVEPTPHPSGYQLKVTDIQPATDVASVQNANGL